jgi:hypothetical protein
MVQHRTRVELEVEDAWVYDARCGSWLDGVDVVAGSGTLAEYEWWSWMERHTVSMMLAVPVPVVGSRAYVGWQSQPLENHVQISVSMAWTVWCSMMTMMMMMMMLKKI